MFHSLLLVTCLLTGVEDGGKTPNELLDRAQKAVLKRDARELRACFRVNDKKRENLVVRLALFSRDMNELSKVARKKFGEQALAESLGRAGLMLGMMGGPFHLLNVDLDKVTIEKDGDEASVTHGSKKGASFVSVRASMRVHQSKGRWYLGPKKQDRLPKGMKKRLKAAEIFVKAARSAVKSSKDGASLKKKLKPVIGKFEKAMSRVPRR